MDLSQLMDLEKDLAKVLDTGSEKRSSSSGASKGSKRLSPEQKAKKAAKDAELRAGGKRADEKDWVRRYNQPGGLSARTVQPEDVRIVIRGEPVAPVPTLAQCDCPEAVEQILNPQRQTQSFQPPKPVSERSTDELYRLLAERWERYRLVLTMDGGDRRSAKANYRKIVELLIRDHGQTAKQVVSFIQALDSSEGGE